MSQMLEMICSRMSCRSFLQTDVEREKLEQLVTVACNAPSARNRQLWQFTVVTQTQDLSELYTAVGAALGREDYGFYGANCMILCSNDREHPFGREDCACAMENIMLCAHALDLGSVWINQLTSTCDDARVRSILSRLGVPENHVVYGCAALGYRASEPTEKTVSYPVVWN